MASFRKRGAYQWQAQVRKKGQPLQTKTFETLAGAKQWARAIAVEMDQGVLVSRAATESTTLKVLLEEHGRTGRGQEEAPQAHAPARCGQSPAW